jgi:hypothetical protein
MTSLRLLFSYLYSLVGYVCSAHLVEFRESSPSTILTTVDASSSLLLEEEFEDTKGVIRIRKSKKDRQHTDQNKEDKRDKQRSINHTHKTKD